VTPADETTFISLWQQGASQQELAQRLGVPIGTIKSRASALARQGKIPARPKGGAYPRQRHQAQQEEAPSTVHRPPSTVDPNTWELRQIKHSVRWTVYVPQAMKEELQRRAAARGENPSLLVQQALARWLAEEA
jgi:transposase